LPCATTGGRRLLSVGVASSFGTDALRPYSLIGRTGQGHGQKLHRQTRSPRTTEFCNTFPPKADKWQTTSASPLCANSTHQRPRPVPAFWYATYAPRSAVSRLCSTPARRVTGIDST